MVEPSSPPANGFVRIARKVYNPIGFQKGYNFVLWFIFGGALFGFTLARLMYLDISGVFCGPKSGMNHAIPGECYYYTNFSVDKIGIRLHLYTILPAAFLVTFQFIPAIRHKLILFHCINGYIIILLALVANAGVLMIARHAFGGGIETQAWAGLSMIMTTLGLANAYYNIKRLQIDQHRAWMLRTWFYFANIITLRIILFIAAMVITNNGGYYMAVPCAKIGSIFSNDQLVSLYPACATFVSGVNSDAYAVVHANYGGNTAELSTSLHYCAGMAVWLALALHAIGVEIYLHLTPREAERLRNISYQRQLEAGFKNPGNAGITAQRIGDANDWKPEAQDVGHKHSDATSVDPERRIGRDEIARSNV